MEFQIERLEKQVRPASEDERLRASERIRSLSRPRLAGSEEAPRVAESLREAFEERDFRIERLPFEFSAFPARWGVPIAGGILLLGAIIGLGLLLVDFPLAAFIVLLAAGLLVGLAAWLAPRAIQRLPWERMSGENWLVTRSGRRPRFLVAAHRDTKSQPVSIFLRATGGALAVLGWLALVAVAAYSLFGGPVSTLVVVLTALVAITGAVPILLTWVGNESPGSLDNASGLAALLGVLDRLEPEDDVGFLVTDCEELGLAGARALAGRLPNVAGIINLDGLDDVGPVHLVERFGLPRRGRAPHLAAALLSCGTALGLDTRRRDIPSGIMVEHAVYVRAGIPALTVMRGRLSSLWRVHRPDDDPRSLKGDGLADVVAMVHGALRVLRAAERPREVEPLFARRRAPEDPGAYLPRGEPPRSPLLGYRGRAAGAKGSPAPSSPMSGSPARATTGRPSRATRFAGPSRDG